MSAAAGMAKSATHHAKADATGWIAVAAGSGTVSVAVSAYAPHAFNPILESNALDCLITGSLCGAIHALAILAVVALAGAGRLNRGLALAAEWLFSIGIVVFPGALYGLAMHGPRWLGAVAPLGAVALILGWVTVITGLMTHRAYSKFP